MPDIAGLREFSYEPDRDFAKFFAGRETELNQILSAVTDVQSKWNIGHRFIGGTTILISGAPGSGKTSLLNYFLETHCNRNDSSPLGIRVALQDIGSDDQLHRLLLKVQNQSKPLASSLSNLLVDAAKFAKLDQTAEGIRDIGEMVTESGENQRPICVLIDEIQNADQQSGFVIRRLHEGIQGVPFVPIFAGLPNSDHVLRELGISRLASQSRIGLASLSNDECFDAIRQMFDGFDVYGEPETMEDWATAMVGKSFGFPHHLHNVMSCVARELSQNGGSLENSNITQTIDEIDRRRYSYYESRIDKIVAELPEVLVMLAHDLGLGDTPAQIRKIREYCANTIDDLVQDDYINVPSARQFVNSLIETGIIHLSGDSRTHYQFTIPSMQTWLLEVKTKELDWDPIEFRRRKPLETSGKRNRT